MGRGRGLWGQKEGVHGGRRREFSGAVGSEQSSQPWAPPCDWEAGLAALREDFRLQGFQAP